MIFNLMRHLCGSRWRLLVGLVLTGLVAACGSSSSAPPFEAIAVGFPNSDRDIVAVVRQVNNLIESPTGFVLQILHASDFEANARSADDIRGYSRVLNQLRPTVANTLTLSSGDNYIPGAFYNASADSSLVGRYNRTPGKADIEILNALGIQASALGNHEFDQGSRQVRDLIIPDTGRGYAGALFPYLSANLVFNNNPDGIRDSEIAADGSEAADIPNKIAKSAVITIGGEKIGLVGATTTRLKSISSPGDFVDVLGGTDAASDQVSAAVLQPVVDALIAQGINKVILLAHLQQVQNEYELAGQLRGVDIIIAGGSHRPHGKATDSFRPGDRSFAPDYPVLLKSASGEPVALVNTAANYTYVGRLVVSFNASGILTAFDERSGAYRTDTASGTVDADVEAAVAPIEALIRAKDGPPNIFGRTTIFLNGLRTAVRTRETNFGNLTADANLARARLADPTTVISLKNGGGIRAPLGRTSGGGGDAPVEFLPPAANPDTGKREGDISQLDIESALAFNNTLSLLTVNATQLKLLLENGVSQVRDGAFPGGFPQVAGLAFSFDPTQPAYAATRNDDGTFTITNPGSRIRTVCVKTTPPQVVVRNGTVVAPTATFRLVTLNFLAGGGDSYPFPNFTATSSRVDLVPPSTSVTFASDGAEQKALADFLVRLAEVNSANYPDPTPAQAKRIQNLSLTTDTIEADCR